MPELWFEEEADAALSRLEADPGRERLANAVNRVLDELANDPGSASVRRVRFQAGLWCVHVPTEDDWVVLWQPHVQQPAESVVLYIGPASFA